MQEQTCQNEELNMVVNAVEEMCAKMPDRILGRSTPDEQTVERVAKAIQKTHFLYGHGWREQAKAALAAMPDTKALDAADRLADAANSLLDYMRTLDDGDSATRHAITAYRAARTNKT